MEQFNNRIVTLAVLLITGVTAVTCAVTFQARIDTHSVTATLELVPLTLVRHCKQGVLGQVEMLASSL